MHQDPDDRKPNRKSDVDGQQNVAPQVVGDNTLTINDPSEFTQRQALLPPSTIQPSLKYPARLHALPAKNPDFVGREEDMAKIKAALAEGGAVITALEGMGGIGKTAVGIEVANALRDEGCFLAGCRLSILRASVRRAIRYRPGRRWRYAASADGWAGGEAAG